MSRNGEKHNFDLTWGKAENIYVYALYENTIIRAQDKPFQTKGSNHVNIRNAVILQWLFPLCHTSHNTH